MDADTNTDIKLRNMTSIYISCGTKILLLYRIGSRVVPPSWCGIGGKGVEKYLPSLCNVEIKRRRNQAELLLFCRTEKSDFFYIPA